MSGRYSSWRLISSTALESIPVKGGTLLECSMMPKVGGRVEVVAKIAFRLKGPPDQVYRGAAIRASRSHAFIVGNGDLSLRIGEVIRRPPTRSRICTHLRKTPWSAHDRRRSPTPARSCPETITASSLRKMPRRTKFDGDQLHDLAHGASLPYRLRPGARCSWDRPFTFRFLRSIR